PAHHRDPHSFPTRRSSDLLPRQTATATHNLSLGRPTCTPCARSSAQMEAKSSRTTRSLVRSRPSILSLLPLRKTSSPPCSPAQLDRKSTRLNSSHVSISYA